jgi:polyphosphate kinase 2 (PPK2 family)
MDMNNEVQSPTLLFCILEGPQPADRPHWHVLRNIPKIPKANSVILTFDRSWPHPSKTLAVHKRSVIDAI